MDQKKAYIPFIIMVAVLIILAVGSTYAYFTINIQNNGGTTEAGITTEAVGNSVLSSDKNLSIELSRDLMMKKDNDVTYYASETGGASTTEKSVAIAKATVTGNGVMNCNYTLNTTVSGDMYTNLKNMASNTGQIILHFDGRDYDVATTDFTKGLSGTINGVSSTTPKEIKATFKVINKKDVDQKTLAGTNMTIAFTVKSFVCTVAS